MLTRIACTTAMMAALSTGASPARATTPTPADQAGTCRVVHSRLRMSPELQAIVHALWHRSPIFRRQVARVSQEVDLDITLDTWTSSAHSDWRADTLLRHEQGRLRRATVRIRFPNREHTIVELIAHELEHIVEQLDGVSLPEAARRSAGPAGAVRQSVRGHFETERAHRVGLAVLAEYRRHSGAMTCVEVRP